MALMGSELKAPSWLASGGCCISKPEQPSAKAKAPHLGQLTRKAHCVRGPACS